MVEDYRLMINGEWLMVDVKGLGHRVFRCRVYDLLLRVYSLGIRVWGVGFRV